MRLAGARRITMLAIAAIGIVLVALWLRDLKRSQTQAVCAANMRQIYEFFRSYQNAQGGVFPADLADLASSENIADGSVFVCPDDPSGSAHTAMAVVDQLRGGQFSSYEYRRPVSTVTARPFVLLKERHANHGGRRLVLMSDGVIASESNGD